MSSLLLIASVGRGQVGWQPQAFLLWPEQQPPPSPRMEGACSSREGHSSLVLCSPAVPWPLAPLGCLCTLSGLA